MAGTSNNFDVTWTTEDGGCNYPGFFVSFSGQEKYVETKIKRSTSLPQTTIENVSECSTNVTVSFGLSTGEKFGTTAQTVATTKPGTTNDGRSSQYSTIEYMRFSTMYLWLALGLRSFVLDYVVLVRT
jgi:hypothetical protein